MPIYTPIHIASDALRQTANQPISGGLAKMIGVADSRAKAILIRQIASPNYELRHFLRLCRRFRLEPVVMTIQSDRLSCKNEFKRSLVAPMFIEGINRKGSAIFRRHKITDIPKAEGKSFGSIRIHDLPLPVFHGRLIDAALPSESFRLIDGSVWFGSFPGGAKDFYVDLFLELSQVAIFVEDFVADEHEAEFFRRVVHPAFRTAEKLLGVRPVVSQLTPNRRVLSPLWYAYPASYRAHFNALGCNI